MSRCAGSHGWGAAATRPTCTRASLFWTLEGVAHDIGVGDTLFYTSDLAYSNIPYPHNNDDTTCTALQLSGTSTETELDAVLQQCAVPSVDNVWPRRVQAKSAAVRANERHVSSLAVVNGTIRGVDPDRGLATVEDERGTAFTVTVAHPLREDLRRPSRVAGHLILSLARPNVAHAAEIGAPELCKIVLAGWRPSAARPAARPAARIVRLQGQKARPTTPARQRPRKPHPSPTTHVSMKPKQRMQSTLMGRAGLLQGMLARAGLE